MKTIKINFTDLPIEEDKVKRWNQTPILDYCRKLITEGVDPDTRLEVYRLREEPDLIVTSIGVAADLEVNGAYFRKYRPST